MRRAALLLLVAATASAHYQPGSRVVVVQAENDGVALLVTYKPVDRVRDAMVAASAGAPHRLRSLLAARALAPVRIALDGRTLAPDRVEAKLTERTGRVSVVVLVSVAVPAGAHRLEIDAGESEEPTMTRYLDRAGGRVAATRGNNRLELAYAP